MTLEDYFGGWLKVIDAKELNRVVSEVNKLPRTTLCPEYNNIFRAFNVCPYKDLRVVIIGQDPYSQKGVATGILFGNKKDTKVLSPSLRIIREACINFEIPHNNIIFDPTLESWAKQGMLMINATLTTEVGSVGIHTTLWRPFMTKLLKNLSKYNHGIIYMLFGEEAKTLKPYIDSKLNYILEEKHPAYYSRCGIKMPSIIFEEAVRISSDLNKEPVRFYEEIKQED